MGRKNLCEYWIKATAVPTLTAPRMAIPPPMYRMMATAIHSHQLHAGEEKAVSHDGILIGLHVRSIGDRELVEAAILAVEELHHRHARQVLLQIGVNGAQSRFECAGRNRAPPAGKRR